MTRKKKFIIGGILLFVLAVALIVVLIPNSSANIKDADLIPTFTPISDEANGFHLLVKAEDTLYWPVQKHRAITALVSTNGWDLELFMELMNSNATTLRLIGEALRLDGIAIPGLSQLQPMPGNFDHIEPWLKFARLKAIQARVASHDNQWDVATNALWEVLEFGQQIQRNGGVSLVNSVGAGFKGIGLKELRDMVTTSEVSIPRLKNLIAVVTNYGVDEVELTNLWKMEYQTTKLRLEQMAVGNLDNTQTPAQRRWSTIQLKPFFRLSRTLDALAEATRECLKNVPKRGSEMSDDKFLAPLTNRVAITSLLRGNFFGENLLRMTLPTWAKFLSRKCVDNNNVSATLIILALRCHHLEHGSLPKSLNELVPKYLPQVPVDDFDGQPFRYLPDQKLIYSVGENLKDDGGIDRDAKQNRLDQVYPIPF